MHVPYFLRDIPLFSLMIIYDMLYLTGDKRTEKTPTIQLTSKLNTK